MIGRHRTQRDSSRDRPPRPPSRSTTIARRVGAAAWAGLALVAAPAFADISPFAVRNLSPLVQNFGLPPAEGGRLTPAGQRHWHLAMDVASHSTGNARDGESLLLDGETWRALLVARYGLGRDWELGFDLPLVVQENGVLDGVIDTWHDLSGLPEGERGQMGRDELLYRYRSGASDGPALDNPTGGIGDVRLVISRRLGEPDPGHRRLALRAAVKLPTGDADRFTGSGSVDVCLGLAMTRTALFGRSDLELAAGAGLMLPGRADYLDDRLRDLVPWANATVGWRLTPRVALVAQIDAHRGLYDSGLRELGATAIMLTAGVQIELAGGLRLDLAIGEDPAIDTAPDVVFHIAVRRAVAVQSRM